MWQCDATHGHWFSFFDLKNRLVLLKKQYKKKDAINLKYHMDHMCYKDLFVCVCVCCFCGLVAEPLESHTMAAIVAIML